MNDIFFIIKSYIVLIKINRAFTSGFFFLKYLFYTLKTYFMYLPTHLTINLTSNFFFFFYIQHDKIIERERRWREGMRESKSREEK